MAARALAAWFAVVVVGACGSSSSGHPQRSRELTRGCS